MKYLKRFNEGIIEYDSDNIKKFITDSTNLIKKNGKLTFEEIKNLGESTDIEVVDYEDFYKELSDINKSTAPPRGVSLFALVNPDTNKCRLVIDCESISINMLKMIHHILKHENIHIGQNNRRDVKFNLPSPTDLSKYFSNKDEIMAFSQSISDKVMEVNPKDIKSAIGLVKGNFIYRDIKRNVSSDILKRYKKYIYLYLQKEFDKTKKTT